MQNPAREKAVTCRDVRGESLGHESLVFTIAQYSRWKNRDIGVNHPSAVLLHHLVKWHPPSLIRVFAVRSMGS